MITIVLTHRNRKLELVKRCLDSFAEQSRDDFKLLLVDYGSDERSAEMIQKLVKHYKFIELIFSPVSRQLWNKSKAINIALKKCDTSYFFVGDIDMIFRNDFIDKLHDLKETGSVTYFQVGFLNEIESRQFKSFESYSINHLSNKEATGMTLYPTDVLKNINGYNEFYHGWGAEDSDVHRRLEHAGFTSNFYDKEILMLHQWHNKKYRSQKSLEPFHSSLEQINHKYYSQLVLTKRVKANIRFEWGKMIEKVDFSNVKQYELTNERNEFDAFINGLFLERELSFSIKISKHKIYRTFKNLIKRGLRKKHLQFYSFQEINDCLLMKVITHYRNCYYEFEWDKENEIIELKIFK